MYQIKINKFQGPFELLLDLIDKKKLSINEVSLAEISQQYLEYLKKMKNFPAIEVARFIVIASTLMIIKSRSLMPSLKFSNEEETEIENLEKQLKLYKKFRDIAQELEKIFGKKVIFARESFLNVEPVFSAPKNLSIEQIKTSLENLLDNLPEQKEILPETIVKKTISLEQKMDELIKKLGNRANMCFSDTRRPECQKIDLIVNFLALLELTKRGFIMIKQDYAFGEIEISKSH